ncbi:hypothetical protein HHK36_013480 [Tetracentron sinense]|uniref:Transmembrane protein n=1 Tax=Tetracentron sinense TaxID=13715 RepID=A0A834Z3F2_TETSI|nr:hypothetical protein HHK36_013480 [Tetracentron sinense]
MKDFSSISLAGELASPPIASRQILPLIHSSKVHSSLQIGFFIIHYQFLPIVFLGCTLIPPRFLSRSSSPVALPLISFPVTFSDEITSQQHLRLLSLSLPISATTDRFVLEILPLIHSSKVHSSFQIGFFIIHYQFRPTVFLGCTLIPPRFLSRSSSPAALPLISFLVTFSDEITAQQHLRLLSLSLPISATTDRFVLEDNNKNILAVQTIRNAMMGLTLMATTSILLCSGLAGIISSTYSAKKQLDDDSIFGEFMMAMKYVTLLSIFLFSFLCHSLSFMFMNQVNFLINSPEDSIVTPEYVTELLEKGFTLSTVGNRLFYAAVPLLLWIFGPVMVFFCSVTIVSVLYNLDFVFVSRRDGLRGKVDEDGKKDFVSVY